MNIVLITENRSYTCFPVVFLKQLCSLIIALLTSELCKEQKDKMSGFGVSLGTSFTKTALANMFNMLIMLIVPHLMTYIPIVRSVDYSYFFFVLQINLLHSAHGAPLDDLIYLLTWARHYPKLHGSTHLFLTTTGQARVCSGGLS